MEYTCSRYLRAVSIGPERSRPLITPMPKAFLLSSPPPVPLSRILPPLAWLLSLGYCAWVTAELIWQFSAPASVAAVVYHETDARKVASRVALHVSHVTTGAGTALVNAVPQDSRYTVTGIATGFGALPGFVILEVDGSSTVSLSPGQALPDGRRLVRLLPESAEFELDGHRSTLSLPARGSERSEIFRPPTPGADSGPKRNH